MGVMKVDNITTSLKGEKFFVDTNVWILLTYIASKSFEPKPSIQDKVASYSTFIQKIKEDGGEIYTSPLCLSELGHVIERKSLESCSVPNITLKQFRANQSERATILKDIEDSWTEIKLQSKLLHYTINQQTGDRLIEQLKIAPLDAYDAAFVLTMKENKITNIITDDKDFQTIHTLDIYTI